MNQKPITGYRKRPWELSVLAWFFALVPLLSILTMFVSLVLAGRPAGPQEVLAGFFGPAANGPIGLGHSVLMVALWVLFLVDAWGVFRVARWGFFLCIVSAAANSLFSTLVYRTSTGGAGLQESLGFNLLQPGVLLNLVFFVPVILLLNQKIMAPFFNPRLKWWEQHPRVKALLKIEAAFEGRTKFYQSFDISESGMFLGTGEKPSVAIGDSFPATIHLDEGATRVEVDCKVVWISDGTGRSPVGCGVTFTYRRRDQKKALPRFIQAKIREGQQLERT